MRGAVCFTSLFFLVLHCGQVAADVRAEYEVKAGFIFNFARYVEWPATNQQPLYLCVIGSDPFGKLLDAIEKRDVRGRAIRVVRQRVYRPTVHCDIVYISYSERAELADLLAEVGSDYSLTVSDIDGFAEQGGMIELAQRDNRIQFMINNSVARKAGLRISARLLELARVVY